MPRRWAAAAPRTADRFGGGGGVEERAPAPPSSPRRRASPRLVASTVSALVSTEGMRGSVKSVVVAERARVLHLGDRADTADHAGGGYGQLGRLSEQGLAVGDREEVGARACLISASSPACDEAESPSTATMAATPMAMPRADRLARSLRARIPTLARRNRSRGRSRAGTGRLASVMARNPGAGPGRAVGHDAPVQHLDHPGHASGPQAQVVGDDDDGRPLGVQVLEKFQDGEAGDTVQVPGRLVGQDDRRASDDRPGNGDPLALAPRELGRDRGQLVRQAHAGQGVGCGLAAVGKRCTGVKEPVGHVVENALVLGQEELLEDEPDARGAQGRKLPVAQPGHVEARDRCTLPPVGRSSVPIRCKRVVLPDPEGPTMARSSPCEMVKLTPFRASTGGWTG